MRYSCMTTLLQMKKTRTVFGMLAVLFLLSNCEVNHKATDGSTSNTDLINKSDGQNEQITGKYWKLVEINGQPFTGGTNKEPYIILKVEDHRVNGTGGCNAFSGGYALQAGNRITFSQIVSTEMACPDMAIESSLLKVLQMADNYNLRKDTLILNRARMAPLARFQAVDKK